MERLHCTTTVYTSVHGRIHVFIDVSTAVCSCSVPTLPGACMHALCISCVCMAADDRRRGARRPADIAAMSAIGAAAAAAHIDGAALLHAEPIMR